MDTASSVALGGASGVAILGLYMLIKKLGKSHCVVKNCSGCLTIDSDPLEMARAETTRLEGILKSILDTRSGEPDLGAEGVNLRTSI